MWPLQREFRRLTIVLTAVAVVAIVWCSPHLYSDFVSGRSLEQPTSRNEQRWLEEFAKEHRCHSTNKFPRKLSLSSLKNPKLLKQFRNPCYLDGPRVEDIYCVPYAYQLGFVKAGTTNIRSVLASHPLSMPHVIKTAYQEVLSNSGDKLINDKQRRGLSRFTTNTYVDVVYKTQTQAITHSDDTKAILNLKQFYKELSIVRFVSPHFDFLKQFPKEAAAVIKQGQGEYRFPAITVDMSLPNRWYQGMWTSLEQNQGKEIPIPNQSVCAWIKKVNPKAKIFVIVRDPISRLFSDYAYNRYAGDKTSRTHFHQQVVNVTQKFDDCFESGRPDSLCLHFCNKHDPMYRFSISLYYYRIRDCLEYFPLSSFLAIKFEDYVTNTIEGIARFYDFLGLPPLSKDAMTFIKDNVPKNTLRTRKSIGDMFPETRALLKKFFRPHNELLATLLNDRRFLWE